MNSLRQSFLFFILFASQLGLTAPSRTDLYLTTASIEVLFYPSYKLGRCSGFFVTETVLVTALHCIKSIPSKKISILIKDAVGKHKLEVEKAINFSDKHDLLLLEVEAGWSGSIATLSGKSKRTERDAYAAGHTDRSFLSIRGTCCVKHNEVKFSNTGSDFEQWLKKSSALLMFDPIDMLSASPLGRLLPGLSGGPVVNSDGEVIGIVNGGLVIIKKGKSPLIVAFSKVEDLIELMHESSITVDM